MCSDTLKFKSLTKDLDADYNHLRNNLRDSNIDTIGDYSKNEPLFLGYYNDNNKLVAGLYAYLSLGMMYVDLMWVDERYRNNKIGSKLLAKAEKYADDNNALYVRVNTATFQALEFYLKNNYEVLFKLPLLVNGKKDQFDYYLVKFMRNLKSK